MLPPGKRLVNLFKEKGINAVWADYPGGHVFSVWRNHLNYTAPMLFRQRPVAKVQFACAKN
jgi:enterochelin esterase-like enzyme